MPPVHTADKQLQDNWRRIAVPKLNAEPFHQGLLQFINPKKLCLARSKLYQNLTCWRRVWKPMPQT
eukprot:1546211-Amphidinium_carterae.1